MRLLEAENAELFAEFQTAKDSVKLIETKVVRIAELQVCSCCFNSIYRVTI